MERKIQEENFLIIDYKELDTNRAILLQVHRWNQFLLERGDRLGDNIGRVAGDALQDRKLQRTSSV